MDKVMDHNLSLQYLFHLKTIEYGRKQAIEEMKTLRRAIVCLNEEIENLGKPNDCGICPDDPTPLLDQTRDRMLIFVIVLGLILTIFLGLANSYFSIISIIVAAYAGILLIKDINKHEIASKNYLLEKEKYDSMCKKEEQRLQMEVSLKREKQKSMWEMQEQLDKRAETFEKINEVRGLLYSVNMIPYQFRNLESIGFFYNQVQSSTIDLTDLVLYETERVRKGYNDIPNFIKEKEYFLALYTLQQTYFWDSCVLVMKKINEMDKKFAQNAGNDLLSKLEKLITTMEREGLGVKYQINGPVGAVGDNSHMVGSVVADGKDVVAKVPMQEYITIDSETEKRIIETICSELIEKLRKEGLTNNQMIERKYEEMKAEMSAKEGETTHVWIERIENMVQTFANIAGIGSFAIDIFNHLS